MQLELQSLEPRLALTITDTLAPAVNSIVAPRSQTYGVGSALSFKVTFSENVVVIGMPTLPIMVGDSVRQATWNGKGSGGNSLVFTMPVQSGDFAPSGVSVAGPIGLSDGAIIRDKAGNSLIPAATGAFPKAKVDAVSPNMTGFGAATVTRNVVSLPVTFSEPVRIQGKPSIQFTLGGVGKQLVYKSGSGTNVLVFSYKLARGEAPTSVNVSTQAIRLNGGAITDRVRNNAASLAKPTDVQLSATSISENQPSGVTVGTFTAVDVDGVRDRHTYSLTAGAGSSDNLSFQIVGNELRTTGPFDFETKSSYSVRVKATDSGGLSIEKVFAITVADLDDVVIQFVRVGDAGNEADPDHPTFAGVVYGAVAYEYRVGMYETTVGQYTNFLNAVAKVDTYGLYSTSMGTNLNVAGISRSGSPGSYTYAVTNNSGDSSNRPITFVSWFDAARFANWMHNGQLAGAQNAATTEDGAYTLNGATTGDVPARNAGAKFYIPTENEWYKAAYYKGGGTNAGYWDYATQSDSTPGNTIGGGANQANYKADVYSVTQSASYSSSQNYLTNVGAFTNSASYYGTFDQNGNVVEWTELRGIWGGHWGSFPASQMSSSFGGWWDPSNKNVGIGFRLASPG